MKRCGQLLSWLWVSLALLWPQTPALARITAHKTDLWELSHIDNLPLLGDVQQPGLKKASVPYVEEPDDHGSLLHGTALHSTAPVRSVSESIAVIREHPVFTITLGLPLSCGPPDSGLIQRLVEREHACGPRPQQVRHRIENQVINLHTNMSFLSSHRLHWGVHHELSDNFRIQLNQMIQDASGALPDHFERTDNTDSSASGNESVPTENQKLEALGP